MLKRTVEPPPEHLFPTDEWRLREARWSEAYYKRAETAFALGNGYLGMRGVHDEGRPVGGPLITPYAAPAPSSRARRARFRAAA